MDLEEFANLIAISLHNSKSIVTEEFYWELRIIVPIKSNTGFINNNCIKKKVSFFFLGLYGGLIAIPI